MNIKKIENDVVEYKHRKYREWDKQFNRIKVSFEVDESKPINLRIESVELHTEKGTSLPYNDGTGSQTFHGHTNMPTLPLCFEMDECQLLTGATFTIILLDPKTEKAEKHIWVLNDEKWEETSYQIWK